MRTTLVVLAMLASLTAPAFADDEPQRAPEGGKQSQWYTPRPGFEPGPGGDPRYADRRDWDRDRRDWDRDGDRNRRDWDRDRYRNGWNGWYRGNLPWRDERRWRNGWNGENWLDGRAMALLSRWSLWNFDYNRDGVLNRYEYEESQRRFWRLADRDGDGRVSNGEWDRFCDRYLR